MSVATVIDPSVVALPTEGGETARIWLQTLASWSRVLRSSALTVVLPTCSRGCAAATIGDYLALKELLDSAVVPLGVQDVCRLLGTFSERGSDLEECLDPSQLLLQRANTTPGYVAPGIDVATRREFVDDLAHVSLHCSRANDSGAVITIGSSWSDTATDVVVSAEIALWDVGHGAEDPLDDE